MSTKTTFKRIALVAVAALGLGVLSVAPSSATASNLSVTITNGTAGLVGAASDTTTGALIQVSGLLDAGKADTITVSFAQKGDYPATATTVVPVLQFIETSTSTVSQVDTSTVQDAAVRTTFSAGESVTATGVYSISSSGASGTYVGANFRLMLDSTSSTTRPAGTYSYTIIVKQYSSGVATPVTTTYDAAITITAAASASKTASAVKSFAKLTSTSTTLADGVASAADATLTGLSTAGSVAGYLYVGVRNADGTKYNVAEDSITVTLTGVGNICDGTTCGKSLKVKTTGDKEFSIVGDGSTGSASIVVSTTVNTYAAKSVTFYAKSPTAITTSNRIANLKVGSNSGAVQVTAVDGAATWTGPVWIVASSAADALIAGSTTPDACSAWTAANGTRCSITAYAPGTAKFKVIDASTVATSTTSSAEFSVTVTAATAASVAIAFDKTSYQPYEKALITVTPLDSTGKAIQDGSYTNLLASGGITATQAFTGSSDTLTAVDITTSATTSASSNTIAGARTYVVYMPAYGDVTISATGGTGLPLAGQVKVSATASVVNNAVDAATDAANEATDAANAATDAALAAADAADAATAAAQDASDAVAALSAEVSKMIASLKAQITSLTNLVIKIQKKVKA